MFEKCNEFATDFRSQKCAYPVWERTVQWSKCCSCRCWSCAASCVRVGKGSFPHPAAPPLSTRPSFHPYFGASFIQIGVK